MKVLLISANRLVEPYPVYPVGLDYVAGALGGRHEVKTVDLNTLADDHALVALLTAFRPDVAGISLRNIDNTDTTDPRGFMGEYVDLVQTVRRHTDAVLVLGGSGFTIFPERILDFLKADYGIIGEGERLALLLEALENGRDPESIPGVISPRNQAAAPAPWDHPFERDAVTNRPYLTYYLQHGGMLNLQTKRGCPFHCVYCTYPAIEGHRMRQLPPEDIAATALSLAAAGARYLFITDSSFNADTAHSLAVARAFKKAGLAIPWGAFFTPRQPPAGYYRELAAAGLTHVEFGTDALSDPVLAAYGKPFNVAQALAAHERAVAAGLHVAHYFLLGGPGETPDSLEETLANIDRLTKTVVFLFCGMRIYPGTPLYNQAVAEGRIDAADELLDPVFYTTAVISRRHILDRVATRAQGRINWVIGSGGTDTSSIISRMYQKGYSGPLWEYLIR
jgi:radical SAM superfamily enzyme YgiQ (UPF0313 family)